MTNYSESRESQERASPDVRAHVLAAIQAAIEDNQAILDAFHAESDRGAILIAAQFLDVSLEKLLRATFVYDYDHRLFALEGALGTFSTRIQLAYATGLIHKSTAANLNRIRKIRNTCAHTAGSVNFESDQIRGLTNAMWTVDAMMPRELLTAEKTERTRGKFLMNVALIYTQLLMVLRDAQDLKREQLWYAHQLGKEQSDKTLAQLEKERVVNEARFAEMEQHFARQDQEITKWVDSELQAAADDLGLTLDEVRKRYNAIATSANDSTKPHE